jgi:hypothetical protein
MFTAARNFRDFEIPGFVMDDGRIIFKFHAGVRAFFKVFAHEAHTGSISVGSVGSKTASVV